MQTALAFITLPWFNALMAFFLVDWQDDADRKEETLAIIADLLGFSWTGKIYTQLYTVQL